VSNAETLDASPILIKINGFNFFDYIDYKNNLISRYVPEPFCQWVLMIIYIYFTEVSIFGSLKRNMFATLALKC